MANDAFCRMQENARADKLPAGRLLARRFQIVLLAAAVSFSSLFGGCGTAKEAETRVLPFSRGMNIGNALDAPKDEYWGVTVQNAYFDAIVQAGFDFVRLPVRFSDYTSGDSYTLDETFMQQVDGFIRYALGKKLYIILDLHHFLTLQKDPETYHAEFLSIWKQLSARYAKWSSRLVFEILNEPMYQMNGSTWNTYMAEALDIIRENNPTRWVILDADQQASLAGLQDLELPDDRYIAASFHFYSPLEFTMQANANLGYESYRDITWTGSAEQRATLSAQFAIVKKWQKKNKIPVLLGEFGADRQSPAASRKAWVQAVREESEKNGFGWAYWEFCSEFGIYDAQANAWDQTMVGALLHKYSADASS